MKRVIVTKPIIGLCYMQVCAVTDATDEEILDVANAENPSGTKNGWVEIAHENHPNTNAHPITCADDPERVHYILIC